MKKVPVADHNMADLNDTLVKASVTIDDGRDWTAWLVWDAKKNYRRSNRIHEPAPARPQVAPVKIEPKKKPRKRGHRVVQQAYRGGVMNKAILIVLLISASALADSPHCVSESTSGKMVTQCDDGTVTVVGSFGSVTVCKTASDTVTCKTVKE